MSVENLRRQYTLHGLSENAVAEDPIRQFDAWMQEALDQAPDDWVEPHAMTLATSTSTGDVSARIVLLRGYDAQGFVFYTNYDSRKAQDLADNRRAALVFHWGFLERQIRICGTVDRVSREQSEAYFHSRPRESQISACISRQSHEVASRTELEQATRNLSDSLGEATVPLPDDWGGYCLAPDQIEFWQGRANRLHDRLVYVRQQERWVLKRLSP
jgi:pyridoxamine 5'-phosphate oxidase